MNRERYCEWTWKRRDSHALFLRSNKKRTEYLRDSRCTHSHCTKRRRKIGTLPLQTRFRMQGHLGHKKTVDEFSPGRPGKARQRQTTRNLVRAIALQHVLKSVVAFALLHTRQSGDHASVASLNRCANEVASRDRCILASTDFHRCRVTAGRRLWGLHCHAGKK